METTNILRSLGLGCLRANRKGRLRRVNVLRRSSIRHALMETKYEQLHIAC